MAYNIASSAPRVACLSIRIVIVVNLSDIFVSTTSLSPSVILWQMSTTWSTKGGSCCLRFCTSANSVYFRSTQFGAASLEDGLLSIASFPNLQGVRVVTKMSAPAALRRNETQARVLPAEFLEFDTPMSASVLHSIKPFSPCSLALGLMTEKPDGSLEFTDPIYSPRGFALKRIALGDRAVKAVVYSIVRRPGRRFRPMISNAHEVGAVHLDGIELTQDEALSFVLRIDGLM